MPRNTIGKSPFPLQRIDKDELVTLSDIDATLGQQGRATICLRSATGPENRGGYFFNLSKHSGGYDILDFEGNPVGVLTSEKIARFVNHVSGRLYDQEMFKYCQSVVNIRQDETDSDSDA